MNNAVSAAIGAAAGIGTDVMVENRPPKHRAMLLAGGLVVAAAIYPLARRERPLGAPLVREIAGLVAAGAIASVAARKSPTTARNVVAAGWAAHAGVRHGPRRRQRLADPEVVPRDVCGLRPLAVAGRVITA